MKNTRLGSIAVVLGTVVFAVGCFVGPACGCSKYEGPIPEDAPPSIVGAVDVALTACEPLSWDLDLGIEEASLLRIFPHLYVIEGGQVMLTITSGEQVETFEWVASDEVFEPFEIEVRPGELVSVSFATTQDNTLDWEFALDSALTGNEALVTPFEDLEAPVPADCAETP